MPQFVAFHLHGDNIVECERTVSLIRGAFATVIASVEGPHGLPVCPSYKINFRDSSSPWLLTLYPGFGRWDHDILNLVRRRGGTLREAADVIITGIADGNEAPLLAIEYCGALPAGNQAWQRSGRAYSFGKAHIPYLYIAELGGFELDVARNRKAARLPNPAVPFSYVAYSLTNKTPAIPIFVPSPGADENSRSNFASVFAEMELLAIVRSALSGEDFGAAVDTVHQKALAFVAKKASSARQGKSLSESQWAEAFIDLEQGKSLVDFVVKKAPLQWAKVAYIEAITPTARSLMDLTARLAVGLTAGDLPMCVVPAANRHKFADAVEEFGKSRIQSDFIEWLRRDRDLTICWVMGFKPRGDDARPDRGLPPLTRMLAGPKQDLLTVIYGPAPKAAWSMLHTDPRNLIIANGLWEVILEVSDAILVDSATDGIRRHGYLKSHWHEQAPKPKEELLLVSPYPTKIGENDVDTVLHLLLAHFAGPAVFEGMCNPPGGDWSGISLQSARRTEELRWLTLPRVSKVGAKRPDHVFQIFRPKELPIVLSIESKETGGRVEQDIGPRLVSYTKELMKSPASVARTNPSAGWKHSTTTLRPDEFEMASAVAFISTSSAEIGRVIKNAKVDLLLCFDFQNKGAQCSIRLIAHTPLGVKVAAFLAKIPVEGKGIELVFQPAQ